MGFDSAAPRWEARIMRDDVMSYGGIPIVSSITLAAMEDLGFPGQLLRQCMAWGQLRGATTS